MKVAIFAFRAEMYHRLLTVLLLNTVGGWRRSQNTSFKKSSEMVVTKSRWLITLVIDLKPYGTFLDKFKSEVITPRHAGTQLTQKY